MVNYIRTRKTRRLSTTEEAEWQKHFCFQHRHVENPEERCSHKSRLLKMQVHSRTLYQFFFVLSGPRLVSFLFRCFEFFPFPTLPHSRVENGRVLVQRERKATRSCAGRRSRGRDRRTKRRTSEASSHLISKTKQPLIKIYLRRPFLLFYFPFWFGSFVHALLLFFPLDRLCGRHWDLTIKNSDFRDMWIFSWKKNETLMNVFD